MPSTNELLQEGRYRIGQRATGSEDVFEAYDTVRNTNVVVREIPVRLNKVATVSQRESLNLAFTDQAKALAGIEHRSLPHVHDYFSEVDRQFLVMDPVDGEDLASLLSRAGRPFDVSKVTDWADQLLDALHYLHTQKPSIIHRNVRPDNVCVDQSGKITLLGVGVSSEAALHADDSSSLRYSPIEQIWPGLDPASQKAITNNYDDRSERILKEPLDARSDIYSLGATLYSLITGREPVDPLERSIDLLEGKLDPLREPTKVNSNIPAEISDVLMKALEIKRENRYDSAFIMRQVLKDAIGRVQERLDEEAREEAEAAEIIRRAALTKNDAAAGTEPEKREAEELQEKLRQAEQQEQKLREAEEQERQRRQAEEEQRKEQEENERRLREVEEQRKEQEENERRLREVEEQLRREAEEELRRAEAARQQQMEAEEEALRKEAELRQAEEDARLETLRREQEDAAAIAEALAPGDTTLSENVLEIPAGAEVTAYRDDLSDIDEDELAAVLEELEAVEAAAVENAGGGEELETDDDLQVESEPMGEDEAAATLLTEQARTASQTLDADDQIFSIPEEHRSPVPMLAIAGAVGLVIVIAVGIWFAMSGQSQSAPPPAQLQPVQAAQPAPEMSPATDEVTATPSGTESANTAADPQEEQPVTATRNAPATVKPKKAEAAKPEPQKKKAVTVDDLINDN